MTRPRYHTRPDANQPDIVDALVQCEFVVWNVSRWCAWADIFVGGYDVRWDMVVWRAFEIKVPGGKLTKTQREFMEAHPGMVQQIETADQVLQAFGRSS